ncbi:S66 peptidase family protein [Macrococcus carouselicus]|uniref:S66 family peptidase n=1 Tax=Macrococcus carouselicus TaxID=69969 RepID=UPI003132C942
MLLIKYPILEGNFTIGVTAPSSGLTETMYGYIHDIKKRFSNHEINIAPTTLMQHKAKSTEADVRASELNAFFKDHTTNIIIPPFGGELALEIINKIDYRQLRTKWLLGYSDISTILLAITLKTGIATAHGPNLVDLRGVYSDSTTDMWTKVLKTKTDGEVIQCSSEKYQSKWDHNNPTECVFNLDSPTEWKVVNEDEVQIEGRLLGGCTDVIHHLIGTPFGDVNKFRETFINNDAVIWYLENCEANSTEFRRTLLQMQLAGWFDNCSGLLFGRTRVVDDVEGYTIDDVYKDLAEELKMPVIYDIDCGHMPPQMTFINDAYAIVECKNGNGKLTQRFI